MKILVTGINGFVGPILRKALESKGHLVYGIDMHSPDSHVYPLDITDASAVTQCVEGISPDFIYHLAAISKVAYEDPSRLYTININGTINLLTASVNLKKKPNVLFVSSCQVYGIVEDSNQPITEETKVNPINHYGASKCAGEHIARVFHSIYELPVAIVRPFNHTGKGQTPDFIIPKIIRAVKGKNTEIILGDTEVIREFMDVRDVVDIYSALCERFPNGKTFNIASGRGYKLSDILQLIQDMTGIQLKIKSSESLFRKNEIKKLIGDGTALKESYGWKPAHGIKETLEWLLTE
jgi:nucleoside-diphosphate-sugar epimerase